MISRLGLLVAVSITAYGIRQLMIRTWKSTLPTNYSENGEEEDKDASDYEEEKVNPINSAIHQVNSKSDLEGEDSLHELRDVSREPELPLLDDKESKEKVNETHMENKMIELERALKLVMELEERNVKLEGELLTFRGLNDWKSNITELQKELTIKKNEDIDMLKITISSLQAEIKKLQEETLQGTLMKKEVEAARSKIKELERLLQLDANKTKGNLISLKHRVSELQAKEEEAVKKEAEIHKKLKAAKDLEVEILEIKRKNEELQHEKKELSFKLDVLEARITSLTKMTENEIITKEREEAHKLRRANEELIKQVEGLQMNRFGEVEELVYLRWVNACLRYELRNNKKPSGTISARDLNENVSPKSQEKAKQLMLEYGQADTVPESNFSHLFSTRSEDFDNISIDSSNSISEKPNLNVNLNKLSRSKGDSPGMMSSSQRWKDPLEALMTTNTVDKKDTSSIVSSTTNAFDTRSSMVKADVETQGHLVMSLAEEVRAASFSNMEDVISFVIRLDEELSFLGEERAILRHFDWPEGKAEAFRQAASEYQNLTKLGEIVSSFVDNPKLTCEVALRKMNSILDKVEQSVDAILRTRDMTISRYKEFGIPVDWLLDSRVVAEIKLSSVQLAKKYMKRIVSELDARNGPEKERNREFLLLQGLRFAIRVHQFAGGFDAECMKSFEELRSRVHTQVGQNK